MDRQMIAEPDPDLETGHEPIPEPPEPPEAPGSVEPLGVYLQWLILGVMGGAFLLQWPLRELLLRLSLHFPDGAHVATVGGVSTILLATLERGKRDRATLGALLNAITAVLLVVAVGARSALVGYGTPEVWLAVLLLPTYGVFHLVCLEDWIEGKAGPRAWRAVASLRDLATSRWWFWSSKVARLQRAREDAERWDIERARATEETARLRAEHQAATAAAERKSAEDRLAAARAKEEAAVAEKQSARERAEADEAVRRAAEVQAERARAEAKVAAARQKAEELGRHADAAALARTQMRGEQLAAAQRVLQTAIAAKDVAARAMEQAVEADRARELLEMAQEELLHGTPEPTSPDEVALGR